MNPQAYPLQWPSNWPRTEARLREKSKMRTTLAGALGNLRDEIGRFGSANLTLSSNCTLGQSNPSDPGVVAYFKRGQKMVAIPCDRWLDVASNVQAIAKTIEALRGIERWGAKHMVDASLFGFAALPSSQRPWHEILGVAHDATAAQIKEAYHSKARECHPDTPGGSKERMAEVNVAYEEAGKKGLVP